MPLYAKSINLVVKFLSLTTISALFLQCASVKAPTGGPRDTIAPKVIRETPPNQTRNFDSQEIQIVFDEFVKLTNEFTEVTISPFLEAPPEIRARKNNITIKLDSQLDTATTYTINFGKAISDVNESNVLLNYNYVFSTGPQIDSLTIAGRVRDALTNESVKDAVVFILPVSQDSTFGKRRPNVFAITDTAGRFVLRNLREDQYSIYALNEGGGGDRIYNGQNEEIGFLDSTITLNRNISNVELLLFREDPQRFAILERKIESDARISLTFNQKLPKPAITILNNVSADQEKRVEFNSKADSATIWLPSMEFDSLSVAVHNNAIPLDTVTIRRNKRDTYNRNPVITDNLAGPRLRPRTPLYLELSAPAGAADQQKITLLEDSVRVTNWNLTKVPGQTRTFTVAYPFRTGKEYILKAEEGAIVDEFGNRSRPYIKRFQLDTDENYGNMSANVTVADTTRSYIIQWMSERFELLRQDNVTSNTTINYRTFPTGKYRIRIIYDMNRNGRWDPGNLRNKTQPEPVWNYDKIISLRPNWDVEEQITIPPNPR